MRSTQKRKSPDAGKIQALIDNVADCQQQAVSLKLGLIHYFLDMASTELKLLQSEELRNSLGGASAEGSGTGRSSESR